jgi:hypothetical protein
MRGDQTPRFFCRLRWEANKKLPNLREYGSDRTLDQQPGLLLRRGQDCFWVYSGMGPMDRLFHWAL